MEVNNEKTINQTEREENESAGISSINVGKGKILNSTNTNKPKKNPLWVNLLSAIAVIFILGVIINNLPSQDTSNEKKNSNVIKLINTEQFSNVSAKKLREILGKPSSTDKWNWTIPSTGKKVLAITYTYDRPKSESYEFMEVNKKIVRFTYNCETQDLSQANPQDIFKMFGITLGPDIQILADTGSALRYRRVNDKIDELWVVGLGNSSTVKITYDLSYFGQ